MASCRRGCSLQKTLIKKKKKTPSPILIKFRKLFSVYSEMACTPLGGVERGPNRTSQGWGYGSLCKIQFGKHFDREKERVQSTLYLQFGNDNLMNIVNVFGVASWCARHIVTIALRFGAVELGRVRR